MNLDGLHWRDGRSPECCIHAIEGDWPTSLRGCLLRNGPGLFQRGSERLSHLFDGDGLVQRWSFGASGPAHACSYVQTEKFASEQQAGGFVFPGFAGARVPRRQLRRPDDVNTANTNLIELAGCLYALWEPGSAYVLDGSSLETIGVKVWSPETATAPFGAHPKRDRQGTLWNIGVGPEVLILYEISASGRLKRQRVHRIKTSALVHDFLITDRYLVVALAPLGVDPALLRQGLSPLDAMVFDGGHPSRLIVIDRDDLGIVRTIDCEPELIFHGVNGWEAGGELHLHVVRSNLAQLRDGLSLCPDRQRLAHAEPSQALLRHVDLQTGRSRVELLPGYVEFPQIDLRWTGRRHRYSFHLLRHDLPCHERGFNAIQCFDLLQGVERRWVFPAGFQLEEHVVVPAPDVSGEAGGWLVGTGFDASRQASFCSIFEARAVDRGPIAMAYLNAAVPPCFHGSYVGPERSGGL